MARTFDAYAYDMSSVSTLTLWNRVCATRVFTEDKKSRCVNRACETRVASYLVLWGELIRAIGRKGVLICFVDAPLVGYHYPSPNGGG